MQRVASRGAVFFFNLISGRCLNNSSDCFLILRAPLSDFLFLSVVRTFTLVTNDKHKPPERSGVSLVACTKRSSSTCNDLSVTVILICSVCLSENGLNSRKFGDEGSRHCNSHLIQIDTAIICTVFTAFRPQTGAWLKRFLQTHDTEIRRSSRCFMSALKKID